VLLLGSLGQLGTELELLLKRRHDVVACDAGQLDLVQTDRIVSQVRAIQPEIIVNAAAYTAVDRAEGEPDLAAAVNSAAPAVLAVEARRLGALFVHYSTDYVFDGLKSAPYIESDRTSPISVYGRTKLGGEIAIREAGCRYLVLRTSGVYSRRGRNFVLAILRQAEKGLPLRVVSDQITAPTWAFDLASLTVELLKLKETPLGTFHAAAAGEASWHEVACEVARLALPAVPVEAVTTDEYPTTARRPRYSVLDSTLLARTAGVTPIAHWRERLAAYFSSTSSTGMTGANAIRQ
jgi:dTDP-4-dehydrorhamnose reductase